MVQKSQRSGQPIFAWLVGGGWLLFAVGQAFAQDYPVSLTALDYNALLAEKLSVSHPVWRENSDGSLMDAVLSAASDRTMVYSETASVGSAPLVNRYSAGWPIPVSTTVRTGPVAQFAVDDSTLSCPKCEWVDSNNAGHIASLGWRIDATQGWITPWAQVSYSHQLTEENPTLLRDRPASSDDRDTRWVDVSVGATLPFGPHLAAFASFSQSGAVTDGEPFIYSLGVSASF